ncbi:MAG: hypothetical protein H6726_17940 [Sandaracinaceae bacterium]|nr:hypothetical protein [Sandaracinaceae bacterium]
MGGRRALPRLLAVLITLSASALALLGCGDTRPINRVGTNVTDKSAFEGSWYFSRTVVGVDYEGGGLGTFPGDAAIDYVGSDLAALPRIRWVIDEDLLVAYRDYELLEGGNPSTGPDAEVDFGQPVAAYAIEKHFDIRRAYNPNTGEQLNVIEENDTDRPWNERQYMRVDWSKNLLSGYYGQSASLYELLGLFERQPADLFVQAGSRFPDAFLPQYAVMPCDGSADEDDDCTDEHRPHADDYAEGQLYHFSFVTQDLLAPGTVADPFTGQPVNWCASPFTDAPTCTTTAVYVRNAFLRVSDTREYEPQQWSDARFERAGYFRLERPTLDRSTAPDDPAHFGTDFRNYNVNRLNLWRRTRDESGALLPYAQREVRRVVYHTTPELPAHLVEPSFELTGRWNESFMGLVRELRGEPAANYPDVPCQALDPDTYCFCILDPADNGVLNPTCPGRYDPFETPAEASARGVMNPYDCHVEVPPRARPNLNDPALSNADFFGWFGARQVGSECVLDLVVNTCNERSIAENGGTTDGLRCQERGDMRYKFLSYVDQPGTPFLGIATLRGDPVTGELLVGDANVGGPALDAYRTTALQTVDLVTGNITDPRFSFGEDVRQHLENLGNVELPARPRVDFNVAAAAGQAQPSDLAAVDQVMARFMDRAQRLSGPGGRSNTFVDRRASLVGGEVEARLTRNMEVLMMSGVDVLPDGVTPENLSEEQLDQVSPLRTSAHEQLRNFMASENRASGNNVLLPNSYVDTSVTEFALRHVDWPRARLEIAVNRLLYYQTMLHELGHCLGLRHDFGASADTHNYDDAYYHIADRAPLPTPEDFDLDGTLGLSPNEQLAFENALDLVQARRELAGIDRFMDSSVMEYTAQWYERTDTTIGRYDHAALALGYGDLVEVQDNRAGRALTQLNPVNTPRAWAQWYEGGEPCETDADCPYALNGESSALLREANRNTGATQRCVAHPNGETAFGRICSNFDDDLRAATEAAGPNAAFAPVDYRFCSDERVGTLGWCHRFDEGDSYRAVVRNVAEQYEREYIFTNFRRYRANFSVGGYLFDRLIGRHFTITQDLFQNLLYRYASDPEFRNEEGAFGFYDQFMASADALNFYARVLAQPDIGSYRFQEATTAYERFSANPNAVGADLRVELGLGRFLSSSYQRGLTGISRLERIGSFYDKWFTMQMLTQRGWTQSYARDVPFWTNWHDLFPLEMQQILQALIQDQPEALAPRLACASINGTQCTGPRLLYMDLYRGDCADASTCRPDPVSETYAGLAYVDGGSSVTLQFLAAVFALTDLPVFFDTSFQSQMFLCVEGQGDCTTPSPTAIEGTDYVRYTSERLNKSFLAFQVSPSTLVINQTSIAFAMVAEARDAAILLSILEHIRDGVTLTIAEQQLLMDLEYTPPMTVAGVADEIDRFEGRLSDLESFFFQLIQLERELGIGSYLGF